MGSARLRARQVPSFSRPLGALGQTRCRVESQTNGRFSPCPSHRRIVARGAWRATLLVLLALGSTACKNSPPDCFYFVNPRVEGRRGNFCSAGTTRLEYRRERRYSGFDPRAVRKRAGRIHGILPALFWSGLRGSNPPPRPWQGRALPNELNPRSDHRSLVPPVGIEPTTRGFSVLCSTN